MRQGNELDIQKCPHPVFLSQSELRNSMNSLTVKIGKTRNPRTFWPIKASFHATTRKIMPQIPPCHPQPTKPSSFSPPVRHNTTTTESVPTGPSNDLYNDRWAEPRPSRLAQAVSQVFAMTPKERIQILDMPQSPPLPAGLEPTPSNVNEFWRTYWQEHISRQCDPGFAIRGYVNIPGRPAAVQYLDVIEEYLKTTKGIRSVTTSSLPRGAGDRFAEMMARVLPETPSICDLTIFGGHVTNKGALALCKGIEKCPQTLTSLNLVNNLIRDKGKQALESLSEQGKMKTLWLGDNMTKKEQSQRRKKIVRHLLIDIPLWAITPRCIEELCPGRVQTPKDFWAMAKQNWKKLVSG